MDAIPIDIKKQVREFIQQKIKEEKNKAVIYAPYKLSQEEIEELKRKFPVLKNRKIEVKIDREILAGFLIRIGSYVLDFTVNDRLKSFKNLIYENS